jgi:hypothetical protein
VARGAAHHRENGGTKHAEDRPVRFSAVTDFADRAGAVAAALFLAGVALLPIMQVRVGVGTAALIPADIAFVLSGASALVAIVLGRLPIRRTLFVAGCLAYAAALLIVLFAHDISRTTLSGAATGIYVAGLAVLAHHLVPSRVSAMRFLKVFLAATGIAVGASVVGVALFYAGLDDPDENRLIGVYGNVPSGRYPRVIGTFLSPNLLCNFLICGLVAVLTARHLGVISRRLATVFVAATVVAIAFTLSPGIGGAFLAAGVWVWAFPDAIRSAAWRRRAVIVALAGVAAFVALTVVTLNLDDGLQPSLRVRAWQGAGERVLERPVLGVGLDENLGHVRPSKSSDALITDAHNLWLSVAGQMGVVGVIAIGAAFLAPFVDAERRRRVWQQPVARGLAIALLGALGFQGLSLSAEDARHLWVLLGVVAALAYDSDYDRDSIVVS